MTTLPTAGHARVQWLICLTTALMLVAALGLDSPAAAEPLDASTKWSTDDPGFVLDSAATDVNGDGVDDVITSAAHRGYFWVGTDTALANPGWALNYAATATQVTAPPARLSAIDGATGAKLWTVTWAPTPSAPDPSADIYEVDAIVAGAIDDQPGTEVMVWRRVFTGPGTWTSYVELYDGATGAVKSSHDSPYGTFKFVEPVMVGDRQGAVVSGGVNDANDLTLHDWEVQIVTADEDGLVVHATVPFDTGTSVAAKARPLGDGFRIVTSEMHPSGNEWWPKTRLIDVDGAGRTTVRWARDDVARHGAYDHELLLTGGSDPVVVYSTGSRLIALDESTGAVVWESREGTTELLGTMKARDVNDDGVRDVIVSPTVGHSYWGAVDESDPDFASEVIVLDGATGETLFRTTELLGKYGASTITFADLDGDGTDEIVAGFLRNDGFPFYGGAFDDPAMVASFDAASGDVGCRWLVDRLPNLLRAEDIDGTGGQEVLVTEVDGTTSALTATGTACEVLGVPGLPGLP